MKAWSDNDNEKVKSSDYIDVKIYPSKKGWKLLKQIHIDMMSSEIGIIGKFGKKKVNEDIKYYSNKEENSFLMSIEKLCDYFYIFLKDRSLVVNKPRIVKSRMHKFLDNRNITLQQFKNGIAGFVNNESI